MNWLFTDFDGTLRNSKDNKNKITKEDLEFVKTLQLKGHKIIISTGRPFEHISKHMKENYADFY